MQEPLVFGLLNLTIPYEVFREHIGIHFDNDDCLLASHVCWNWHKTMTLFIHELGGLVLFKRGEKNMKEQQFNILQPFKQLLLLKCSIYSSHMMVLCNCLGVRSLQRMELIGASIGKKGAKYIAESEFLQNLSNLTLISCNIGDNGVQYLAKSSKLKSLVHLDLSKNVITDMGAMTLLKGSLQTLKYLYLPGNPLKNVYKIRRMQVLTTSLKELILEDAEDFESDEELTLHEKHLEMLFLYQSEKAKDMFLLAKLIRHPSILPITPKAFYELCLQSAKMGNMEAQFEVGTLYETQTKFLRKDERISLEWFEKSANQGFYRSQMKLSFLYEDGNSVNPPDLQKSFYWCSLAAEQHDDSSAWCILGHKYDCGIGVTKDVHAAHHWYMKAAEDGMPNAQYLLASMYCFGRYDSESQTIEQDYEKALYWFLKCSESDPSLEWTNYHLGVMYRYGEGMDEPDYAKAYTYLLKAAILPEALYELGEMFLHHQVVGYDFNASESMALEYLTQSAKKGYVNAQLSIIDYFKRQQPGFDHSEAFEWIIENGTGAAQFTLGYLSYKTEPQDYIKAMHLFKRAAEKDCFISKYYLGKMYCKGKGTPVDMELAFEYYKQCREYALKISDKLNQGQTYVVGKMFYMGLGGTVDFKLAKQFLEIANDDKSRQLLNKIKTCIG